jgi:hypothetical protein
MRILVLLLIVALTACGAPRSPEWVRGKSDAYPEALYLLGHGVDADRGRAEDRARAEIAKVFEVKIQLTESSTEAHHLTRIGSLLTEDYNQAVRAELVATTDKILRGVRIAEVWKDDKTGQFNALAVLDRVRTARELRGQINDIDGMLLHRTFRAEAENSAARRFGHYVQAAKLLDIRRGIAADLTVADPAGFAPEAPVSVAEIAGRLDRAAAAIRLAIDLEGDEQQIVRGAMTRALAARGLPLAQTAEPNLRVQGLITMENYRTGDPLNWTVAAGQIDIVDGDGTVLDTLRASIREGSRIETRAETMARERLGQRMAAQLIDFLSGAGER